MKEKKSNNRWKGEEISLQDTYEKSTHNLALELQGGDNQSFLCLMNSEWKTKCSKSLNKSHAESSLGCRVYLKA